MNDVFGNKLSPCDMVFYLRERSNMKNVEYGIYTKYNTLFAYNYWLNKLEANLLEDCKCNYLWNEFSHINSSNLECIKVHNFCDREQVLYNNAMIIYNKRMDAIDKYERIKKHLPIGSVICNRLDGASYMYIGKILSADVYQSDIRKPKEFSKLTNISCIPNFVSDLCNRIGLYTYLSLYNMHTKSIEEKLVEICSTSGMGKSLLNFNIQNNYYVYKFCSYKTIKSNLYYYGKCDLDGIYDMESNLLVISFVIGTNIYYVRLRVTN